MKLYQYTIFKLTVCLIIGIVIQYYFSFSITNISIGFSAVIILLFFSLIISLQKVKPYIFGVIAYICFIGLGILCFSLRLDQNKSHNYNHFIKKHNQSLLFRVKTNLKSNAYYDRYYVEALNIDSKKVKGTLLFNKKKDSLGKKYKVDGIYQTQSLIQPIKDSKNPYQFNYKAYLASKGITHQFYTTKESCYLIDSTIHTVNGHMANVRYKLNTELDKHAFKKNEKDVINALLLGQRQELNKDLYDSYTKAGAIHILAVSGLHIGIIVLILQFLLKPLEFIKYGTIINSCIIIILLWSYALLAGASASIIRAVTMFSLVTIGIYLNRKQAIELTLITSIFILLLYKPLYLFDVGFQLSYTAVFSIVYFQPFFQKLWYPKWKVTRFFWSILTVSVSAQIGILPLSLYYFNQFPSLFWLSNLIIIPFLGIILFSGIVLFILAYTQNLPIWYADAYGYIINLMNHFFGWIANQESFLFTQISFNKLLLLLSFILIVMLYYYIQNLNFRYLKYMLVTVLCIQISWVYSYKINSTNSLTIFHKPKSTLIAVNSKNKLTIYKSNEIKSSSLLNNFKVKQFVSGAKNKTLPVYINLPNKKDLLIIDKKRVYNLDIKPTHVLLRNSPKINLERLIHTLKPSVIIADGSNYNSTIEKWQKTAKIKKRQFHNTGKGAFVNIFE